MVGTYRLVLNAKKRDHLNEGVILTVYMVLKPFYLFSSGLPQISDMFMALCAVFFLLRDRGKVILPGEYVGWIKAFMVTIVFQSAIQLVWWIGLAENKMLLFAAYYVFNFIVAYVCICIGKKIGIEKLKLAICKGCFYSILITSMGFLVHRGSGLRSTGFFNNPNQLGYYALLLATIIAFFPDTLPKWQNMVVIVLSLLTNVMSLSKASILGFAGLALCFAIWGRKGNTPKQIIVKILLLLAIVGGALWFFYSDSSLILENRTLSSLRSRILYMGMEKDSSFGEGRGYDRVWEMGIHFIWGMGEGAYSRFETLTGKEVHATYVNTLVSYGVMGLAAYGYLMLKPMAAKGKTIRNIACFSGVLLYFFTHNGIRNTLLWILIAVVIQEGVEWNQRNKRGIARNERFSERYGLTDERAECSGEAASGNHSDPACFDSCESHHFYYGGDPCGVFRYNFTERCILYGHWDSICGVSHAQRWHLESLPPNL